MPEIPEEHKMLDELVTKPVDQELMPLEKNELERKAPGGVGDLSAEREVRRFYQRDLRVSWQRPFAFDDRVQDFSGCDGRGLILSRPVSGSRRYAMAAFSR